MASKCPSFSCLAPSLSSPFQRRRTAQLRLSQRLFHSQQNNMLKLTYTRDNSNQLIHGMRKINGRIQKQQHRVFVVSEDQSQQIELQTDDLAPENLDMNSEEFSIDSSSSVYSSSGEGKPGVISFYNRPYKKDDEKVQLNAERSQNSLLWFMGPAILVASFIFPSLYLRRILSVIFEDSLLTDFLILFFTEAIFYCGVAVFLFLLDRLRRPLQDVAANKSVAPTPQLGQRISSVATLVLSLIIPMVTMGLVWPWTGPAASATLAPYLVGIVVQFAFEQYARFRKSPSWPAIPFIFQVYRLHQLNRAAQLVTALSFTVRGAEMTSHNLAINSSLGTLLNVLQFLGVICIWSLSSYLMRFLPSVSATTQ